MPPFKRSSRRRKVSEPVKTYVKKAITRRKPKREKTTTVINHADVLNTASFVDMTNINVAAAGVQDDPETYRSQQSLKPESIYLSGWWTADSTATTQNFARLIVFQWRGDAGDDAPTAGEVFPQGLTYDAISKPFRGIDTQRGKILYDRMMTLGRQYDGAATLAGNDGKAIMKTINLFKCSRVKYTGNAGNTGVNHVYICIVGNAGAGANNSQMFLESHLIYSE